MTCHKCIHVARVTLVMLHMLHELHVLLEQCFPCKVDRLHMFQITCYVVRKCFKYNFRMFRMFHIHVSHVSIVMGYVIFISMLNTLIMTCCLSHEIMFY
jgi:hypothetical protein